MNTNTNTAKALLALLDKNIVRFTYEKKDGTIRNAVGTRNLCLACKALNISIPLPKTGRKNPTAYYDLEKQDWRSFIAENVISINGIELNRIKGVREGRIIEVGSPEEVEIPINPMGVGVGGGIGLPIGGGFGSGKMTKAEIDTMMKDLDKEIEIPIGKGGVGGGFGTFGNGFGVGGGFGIGGGSCGGGQSAPTPKVGVPTFTEEGIALPVGAVSVEDFAKLVAKYVVDLLAHRLAE